MSWNAFWGFAISFLFNCRKDNNNFRYLENLYNFCTLFSAKDLYPIFQFYTILQKFHLKFAYSLENMFKRFPQSISLVYMHIRDLFYFYYLASRIPHIYEHMRFYVCNMYKYFQSFQTRIVT